MAFNVSIIIRAKNKFSPVARAVKKSMGEVNKKAVAMRDKMKATNKEVVKSVKFFGGLSGLLLRKVATSISRVNLSLGSMNERLRNSGKRLGEIGRKTRNFGQEILPLSGGLLLAGGFAVKAAAQMETLETSFATITGSAANAKKLVGDLRKFAAKTPFQLTGIGGAAKQLLAFGVTQDKIQDRLKMLGDVASGAGVPLRDMAAIFGKAKAKGKVMTEELLQMSDRGIPIIDTLAKGFGVTKDKIFDMASKSQISFDDLVKAMTVMTSKVKGQQGIFFNQMEKQSNTLAGVYSTLKDNVFEAGVVIGNQIVETFQLKENMRLLTGWIQKATGRIQGFIKEQPKLSKFVMIAGALIAVLSPLLIIIGLMASGIGALVAGFGFLVPVIGILIKMFSFLLPMLKFTIAIFAGFTLPIWLAIAAIGSLIAIGVTLWKNWDFIVGKIADAFEFLALGIGKGIQAAKDSINSLVTKLSDSTFAKAFSFVANLFGKSENTATIDININDSGGKVESTSQKQRGTGLRLNTGVNMAT